MTDCLAGGFHFSGASKLRQYLFTLWFAISALGVAPASFGNITLSPYVSGLAQPVDIANAGDGSGRLFVAEQGGRIRIIQNGFLLAAPFLNLTTAPSIVTSGGEQGLLGLAFHPQYASNGQFFVYFNSNANAGAGIATGDIVIARYQRSAANPNLADPASRVNILTIPHSKNGTTFANHNGGSLRFGPDGYLYAGVGDGGGGGDPFGSGQDRNVLLGKILRLDVNSAPPYIPPTNPFVGVANTRPEIWAYGVRNPWRISFDRLNGDFYIGDVGQDAWEEIDFQTAGSSGGANYGWNVREGNNCYSPMTGCVSPADYAAPLLAYSHAVGNAVAGGYVYRGQSTPDLAGKYVFGDYVDSILFFANGPGSFTQIAGLSAQVSTFGEGESGELYLANISTGAIFSFSSSSDDTPDPVAFFTRYNAPLATTVESNMVKLTGLGMNANISIAGGEYSIAAANATSCSTAYTNAAGMVANDAVVCVRHTSASTANTSRTTTLTAGTSTIDFVSMTAGGAAVFAVKPSVGPNGFLSQNTVQQVAQGQTVSFTITPATGYAAAVGGTCGGTLNGTNYTTNPITANCTVMATFIRNAFAVTPGAGPNGSIAPGTVQSVYQGASASLTVTANTGYRASVGGTCGGTLMGSTYTTNAITVPCSVLASFTFVPVAPDAPVIDAAFPGDGLVYVHISAPASDGGSPIVRYTVDCGGFTAIGLSRQIIVTGLTNGVAYSCSVTATSIAGTGPSSAAVDVTPSNMFPLTLLAAQSRKRHGGIDFDHPINLPPIIPTIFLQSVEPRMIGSAHRIVFQFNAPISGVGSVTVDNTQSVTFTGTSINISGNEVIVTVSGIPDRQRLKITLSNLQAANGSMLASAVAVLDFLVGDVNGTNPSDLSHAVNASDISAVKARIGQVLNLLNFRFDLNASGAIDAADLSVVKARSGIAMP